MRKLTIAAATGVAALTLTLAAGNLQRCDVGDTDFEPGGTDFGDQERCRVTHRGSVSCPLGLCFRSQIDGALYADIVEMLVEETSRRTPAADAQHFKKIVIGGKLA